MPSTHIADMESLTVATEHRMLAASLGSMESLAVLFDQFSQATQPGHIITVCDFNRFLAFFESRSEAMRVVSSFLMKTGDKTNTPAENGQVN